MLTASWFNENSSAAFRNDTSFASHQWNMRVASAINSSTCNVDLNPANGTTASTSFARQHHTQKHVRALYRAGKLADLVAVKAALHPPASESNVHIIHAAITSIQCLSCGAFLGRYPLATYVTPRLPVRYPSSLSTDSVYVPIENDSAGGNPPSNPM